MSADGGGDVGRARQPMRTKAVWRQVLFRAGIPIVASHTGSAAARGCGPRPGNRALRGRDHLDPRPGPVGGGVRIGTTDPDGDIEEPIHLLLETAYHVDVVRERAAS